MRMLRICLILVALAPVWAEEGDAPSIELLLYLAEWGSDEQGETIDPIDLLDAAAMGERGAREQTEDRRPVMSERSP